MDACNFHFHDRQLRSNPPALVRDTATVTDVNPYGMQAHIYDKTQPENIAFLQRLRALLDEYGAVSIGEVGADDALAVMAEYTAGGDKLHMAYSFNLLTPQFTARISARQVEEFKARVKDGWASWSVGNHDAIRVATRWGGTRTAGVSAMVLAMQLSLKGTPCLYQGDELALPEADVPYELLQDPYGITFWPEFKGRDGCRTPMPWTARPNAGFTSGTAFADGPRLLADIGATHARFALQTAPGVPRDVAVLLCDDYRHRAAAALPTWRRHGGVRISHAPSRWPTRSAATWSA
jgi:alpha-glucosidase